MDRMGGMVRLVKKVLICVLGAEGIGAVCYADVYKRQEIW